MFWTRIHQARTSTRLAPATHRNEFQQGIPWRVALQQSPPPLPPLEPVLPQQPPSRQLFAANGELSRYTLSHKRAHPNPLAPFLLDEAPNLIRSHATGSNFPNHRFLALLAALPGTATNMHGGSLEQLDRGPAVIAVS